jgi:hypothetical protein
VRETAVWVTLQQRILSVTTNNYDTSNNIIKISEKFVQLVKVIAQAIFSKLSLPLPSIPKVYITTLLS